MQLVIAAAARLVAPQPRHAGGRGFKRGRLHGGGGCLLCAARAAADGSHQGEERAGGVGQRVLPPSRELGPRGAGRRAACCGAPSTPARCLQVRSMFPLVADAVESVQPGSRAAAAQHFTASEWFASAAPGDSPPGADAAAGAAEAAEALMQAEESMVSAAGAAGAAAAAAAAAEAGSVVEDAERPPSLDRDGSAAAGPELPARRPSAGPPRQPVQQAGGACCPPSVVRPSAAVEAAPQGALRRALDRAGLGRPQLVPALHMLVLFGAAGTLTVVKSAFVGLLGKSDWVSFSGAAAAAGPRRVGRATPP